MTNIFQRLRRAIKSRRSASKDFPTRDQLREVELELESARETSRKNGIMIGRTVHLHMRLREYEAILAHTTSTPASVNDIWLCS
ncbi:hypothetical protein N7491_008765 [Penicillium cf. griseofulvum]|uniref:Uncharacterized protein n=1 Tax=Penicillium cf. griseofulvum TaxID=2972120 RepID=A0A9W9JP16_9EURO|nr:hypothetical protein N7472_005633 [Penicillium cf. griseofulvum]KAJ5423549.1 hypothetical protein N7491_008765 [Penicillium cf. griseofulvum]KAJ5431183.1 hypothetical protein N7445_008915 [Penicillium cf. griseofulvum]